MVRETCAGDSLGLEVLRESALAFSGWSHCAVSCVHTVSPPAVALMASGHDLESGHAESRHTPERASREGTFSSRPTSRCSPKTAGQFGPLTQSDVAVIEEGRPRPVASLAVVDTRRRASASGLVTEAPPEVTPNGRPRNRVVIAIDDGGLNTTGAQWSVLKVRTIRANDRPGLDDLAAVVFTEHARTAQSFKSDRHQRANVRSLVPLGNHLRFCSKANQPHVLGYRRSQPTPGRPDAVLRETSRRHRTPTRPFVLRPDAQASFGRRFAQKSAAFEQRGIGRRGMRGAVANELFTRGPAGQNSGCKLLILVRPARLERATSWFVG